MHQSAKYTCNIIIVRLSQGLWLPWMTFVMKTLDYFNFGTDFKRRVSIFYTNIESAVLNNGFATDWFKPSRGVRQGCPFSPYLFILSAEILAHKIRQDPEFKGIKMFGNKVKLSLFADDTNLIIHRWLSLREKRLRNSRRVWEDTWFMFKC